MTNNHVITFPNNKVKMADKVLNSIQNTFELKNIAKEKGKNHSNYSFYVSDEYIESVVKNGLYLTTGKEWNDKVDSKNINDDSFEFVRFVKSFTFSRSENISMWMLYVPFSNGYLLKYSKSAITHLLNNKKPIEVLLNNKVVASLNEEDYDIELIDIIYVDDSKEPNTLTLKRSDERRDCVINNFGFDLNKDKLDYYVKHYGWAYENECRLVLTISKRLINGYNSANNYNIYLNIPFSKVEIFSSPNSKNFPAEINGVVVKNSKYKGKLNWDLKAKFERNKKDSN